jgi:hypothetical protein
MEALSGSREIIAEMPGAVEALARHEDMADFFHRGTQLQKCDFETDWSTGLAVQLPHLVPMRDACRRIVAYGRWIEAEDKSGEVSALAAAGHYLNVTQSGVHLCQDGMLMNMFTGVACSGIGTTGLQNQMARGIGEETARKVLDGLAAIPDRPFNLPQVLEKERQVFGVWIFTQFKTAAGKDRMEFFREYVSMSGTSSAVNDAELLTRPEFWLLPADKKDLVKFLEAQEAEYNRFMRMQIDGVNGPYFKIHRHMEDVERAFDARLDRKSGGLPDLVNLVLPALNKIYVTVARAEARLAATRLLAAACLENARSGKFPESIEGLKQHFPNGLPIDPFTGKDFRYRIENGLPTVECEGDSPEYKKGSPHLYIFSLSEIKRRQEERAAAWRAGRRSEKPPAPRLPPLPAFPGDEPEMF